MSRSLVRRGGSSTTLFTSALAPNKTAKLLAGNHLLALVVYCLGLAAPLLATEVPTQLASSTYLGSASDHDQVVGVRIAADGTLIVAANVGGKIFEDATRSDLPSFSQPGSAAPRLETFPDRKAFRQAALNWIKKNYPGIPAAPSLEDAELAEVLDQAIEQNAKQHKPLAEEAVTEKVLFTAQDAYIQTGSPIGRAVAYCAFPPMVVGFSRRSALDCVFPTCTSMARAMSMSPPAPTVCSHLNPML